jgi:hypothetical protein
LSRIDFETIIDVEALGRAVGPAPNFATAVQDRTPGGGALFLNQEHEERGEWGVVRSDAHLK